MSWTWVGRGLITVATVGLLTAAPAASAVPKDIAGAGNHAIIDPADTADVLERTNEICEEVFSYNYSDLNGTSRRVADLSTDRFQQQYDELYGQVIEQAPSKRTTLDSKVVKSAVRYLTDEEAQVMVYLDQTSSSLGGEPAGGAAMFLASLKKVDDEWLIDEADFFGAT